MEIAGKPTWSGNARRGVSGLARKKTPKGKMMDSAQKPGTETCTTEELACGQEARRLRIPVAYNQTGIVILNEGSRGM
jgi:hypothetical protein